MENHDEALMRSAIELAREAEDRGEVPVGAVVTGPDGAVIATGSNMTIGTSDPTAHAEVVALRAAAAAIGNYRLTECVMYTTLEPCAMCAGALVNARVKRLVYGTRDERFGAVDTHFGICNSPELNHRLTVEGGVLADECRALMQDFFRRRRNKHPSALANTESNL